MKPLIGIFAHITYDGKSKLGQSSIGNTYISSIEKAGGIPVILPSFTQKENMDTLIEQFDGFLLSGGIDVSPVYYNEEPHTLLGATSILLDETQITFTQKILASKKPILGICRGIQVLNVATGGTLYQDLSEHEGTYIKHTQSTDYQDASHHVDIISPSLLSEIFEQKTLFTNSYHHQAVKSTGPDAVITAMSKDGIPEAIELSGHPFCLGVQWHPEVMFSHGDESMRPIFEAFVNACKQK